MVFNSYADLRAHRSFFLSIAVADVKKWCARPDEMVEDIKPSDQYWLRKFGLEIEQLCWEDARLFLITFKLIRAGWEIEAVATAIRDIAALETLAPTVEIPMFSGRLQRMNKRRSRQTSAASKIATFTHPECEIYIWDALATKAARLRARERGDEASTNRKLDVYRIGEDHDYPAFHAACARARADEEGQPDFQRAVAALLEHFTAQGSEMSDRDRIPEHFIKRRLLDKFMFWEGWSVDHHRLPSNTDARLLEWPPTRVF